MNIIYFIVGFSSGSVCMYFGLKLVKWFDTIADIAEAYDEEHKTKK